MGNDGDYRKQVGIDYHPMTSIWCTFDFFVVQTAERVYVIVM